MYGRQKCGVPCDLFPEAHAPAGCATRDDSRCVISQGLKWGPDNVFQLPADGRWGINVSNAVEGKIYQAAAPDVPVATSQLPGISPISILPGHVPSEAAVPFYFPAARHVLSTSPLPPPAEKAAPSTSHQSLREEKEFSPPPLVSTPYFSQVLHLSRSRPTTPHKPSPRQQQVERTKDMGWLGSYHHI